MEPAGDSWTELLERIARDGGAPGVDLSGRRLGEGSVRLTWSDLMLAGADLRDADAQGLGLSSTDLRGSLASGVDLRRAVLARANLGGAVLSGADLRGASLFKTSLRGARLDGANLTGAAVGETDLSGADLRGVCWQGLEAHGVVVAGAALDHVAAAASGWSVGVIDALSAQGAVWVDGVPPGEPEEDGDLPF